MRSEFPAPIPRRWRGFESRGVAWRLFATCWIIFTLHFSTEIVREHYPALALGDHFSFRLDEYANLHPDLFEKPGYGWHIGNNPGVSMLAAIPYFLARPLIDPVVRRVRERRKAAGLTEPPAFHSPWPNQRRFFAEAWRRGLDVKLGLAAFVMQALFMAPLCALSAVAVFYVLRRLTGSDAKALWLAVLYAFGTPVFYRAAFLNHNMLLGIFAFLGFVAVWDPGGSGRFTATTRFFLAGLAGGTAVLFDYSGIVFLLGLLVYAMATRWRATPWRRRVRNGSWYVAGAAGPILLLWFYQWRSFGNPFLPGQQWMPPVEWIDRGYQGYGLPQWELLRALAFDHRFGLFVFCPLLLLALLAPLMDRGVRRRLPARETWAILLLFLGLWVFFSGSNYTRLQFNTGVRYMAPIVPFLFIPAAVVLVRFRPLAVYLVSAASIWLTWCLAMYREVERPLGVLDPVLRTLTGGFDLPVLRTLARTGGAYGGFGGDGTSALPLFLLAATLVAGVWLVGSTSAEEAR
ncbi:MAG: hypothetical protein ACE5HQ_02895 [Gemmatimonadota bacterium]